MITKTAAVKMSIRKWSALAKGEKPKNLVCGFCEFFNPHRKKDCIKCPLYPDVCSNEPENPPTLYRQYCSDAKTDIAQQILDAIIERGEKWVKNER